MMDCASQQSSERKATPKPHPSIPLAGKDDPQSCTHVRLLEHMPRNQVIEIASHLVMKPEVVP